MFDRYWRAGALVLCWTPIAIAQGQDSLRLARALERAEKFDAAMAPQPQPTAKYAGAPGDLTEAASINEPNMGLPASNQAGYAAGSNPGRGSALSGRLKIMHGTSDVMAPLSTTMRMVQALIEANKTFDLLIMPGQPHGPQGAAGRYYREDVRRYMATHLIRDDASGTSGRQVPE